MKNLLWMTFPVLALAAPLLAGGFYLQLGNPEANPEARKANAALVVKVAGCQDPASATLAARAIGRVDGRETSIPLNVIKLSETGAWALTAQWPKQGKWVIELVGSAGELRTYSLVAAGPDGLDRLHAKADMKAFPTDAIAAMLK
jgi:hypothetical protein